MFLNLLKTLDTQILHTPCTRNPSFPGNSVPCEQVLQVIFVQNWFICWSFDESHDFLEQQNNAYIFIHCLTFQIELTNAKCSCDLPKNCHIQYGMDEVVQYCSDFFRFYLSNHAGFALNAIMLNINCTYSNLTPLYIVLLKSLRVMHTRCLSGTSL